MVQMNEIKRMRSKQMLVINGLLLAFLTIYFLLVNKFNITFTQLFSVLGIILLIQAVVGLVKKDQTKSLIPILEQVAIYEKGKMGREWDKQRKSGNIITLLLSVLMFFQAAIHLGSTDGVFQLDFIFMLILGILIIGMINISMLFHFRKVDRSTSELDMKGYTWKSNLIGGIVGLVFGVFIIVMIVFYVLSGV